MKSWQGEASTWKEQSVTTWANVSDMSCSNRTHMISTV